MVWDDSTGSASVTDLLLEQVLPGGGPALPVFGFNTLVTGSGTSSAPLHVCYELPALFVSQATSLIFGVDVKHSGILEPTTATMIVLAFVGLMYGSQRISMQ